MWCLLNSDVDCISEISNIPCHFENCNRRTITQSANYSPVRQQIRLSSLWAVHKIRFVIVFIYSSTNDPVFHDLHLQQHETSDSYWSSCIAAQLIQFLAVFIFSSRSDPVPRDRHLFPLVQLLRNPVDRLMYIGKISKLCPKTNPLPPPPSENWNSCDSWSRIHVVRKCSLTNWQ
jgi:hypothetical protein